MPKTLEQFDAWYAQQGHYIYSTRQQAIRVWITKGISGLPGPTPTLAFAILETLPTAGRMP